MLGQRVTRQNGPVDDHVGEPDNRFHRNRLLLLTRDQDRQGRTTVQEAGTIRRLWKNAAGFTGAQPPFSWTANGFDSAPSARAAGVSTPLRYLVSTLNTLTAGNQRSMPMRRQPLPPRVKHTPPTLVSAGNVGYRPALRSRVPSFGSRVPPLNASAIPGAEETG